VCVLPRAKRRALSGSGSFNFISVCKYRAVVLGHGVLHEMKFMHIPTQPSSEWTLKEKAGVTAVALEMPQTRSGLLLVIFGRNLF